MASNRFFKQRLRATTDLLELIESRFELDDQNDSRCIYYWILDVERLAKFIGMRFYSRRGRRTLTDHLHLAHMWLRSQIYSASLLTVEDLLDSSGKLRPQSDNDQVFDFEELVEAIQHETEILQGLFREYADKEEKLIAEFGKKAQQVCIAHSCFDHATH